MQESIGGRRREIEEEAARFLVRLYSDSDEAERAQIEAWIASNPAHAVAFARVEAAWEKAERLKGSCNPISLKDDDDVAANQKSLWTRQRSMMIGGALAASLLIAGVGATAKMAGAGLGHSEGDARCATTRGKKN